MGICVLKLIDQAGKSIQCDSQKITIMRFNWTPALTVLRLLDAVGEPLPDENPCHCGKQQNAVLFGCHWASKDFEQ